MIDRPDMHDISSGVARMLRRLGMGDVRVLLELEEEWDEIAGRPWSGASRPIGITGGELVVEALEPGAVSMLRYAAGALVKSVEDRFGEGQVDRVKVIAPPPGGPR